MRRIWEPFFTTKGEEGTGLGLDVAKSIIEAHGGTIDCTSEPNRGSHFTIRLPRVESASEIKPREPAPPITVPVGPFAQPLVPQVS